MTIAALLSLHGMDAPRFVSALGTVQVGSAPASGGMRIEPHTFHGGEDSKDALAGDKNAPRWWENDGWSDRDNAEMATWFPSWQKLPSDGSGPPVWVGSLTTDLGERKLGVIHRVDGALPFVVPVAKPVSRPMNGRLVPSPHLYVTGNLCVADQADWEPSDHTSATVVAWAAHWYACHAEWLLHGSWPSEGIARAA